MISVITCNKILEGWGAHFGGNALFTNKPQACVYGLAYLGY